MSQTVRQALREGAARLGAAGIEGALYEARLLLGEAAGLSQAELLREPDRVVAAAAFMAMVARREGREPLAYIVGYQEFWSLRLAVSPATLIPRADSETLIEAAVAARRTVGRVLDLGTGTGCLLLAALSEFPEAWGVGVDRNPAAAGLARRNAVALGMQERCGFVCGDWAAALVGPFDLVLANPPYIDRAEIASLMPEVSGFEPASALDGGLDGLDAYRSILAALPGLLSRDGLAVLELGAGQRDSVAAMARAAGFGRLGVRRDLAGIERALLIESGSGLAERD